MGPGEGGGGGKLGSQYGTSKFESFQHSLLGHVPHGLCVHGRTVILIVLDYNWRNLGSLVWKMFDLELGSG